LRNVCHRFFFSYAADLMAAFLDGGVSGSAVTTGFWAAVAAVRRRRVFGLRRFYGGGFLGSDGSGSTAAMAIEDYGGGGSLVENGLMFRTISTGCLLNRC
jgi:hypothetical protein